jgi:hypothetical protein
MPFGGAQATHGGCVVHTAQPTCTYSAVGTHSALGFSEGPWEVTVMRPVNGEPTKVVVGGGAGGPIAIEDIATNFGEEATIEMKAADGAAAPVGIISVGNTAEHI